MKHENLVAICVTVLVLAFMAALVLMACLGSKWPGHSHPTGYLFTKVTDRPRRDE